jgi:hypothetical protein
MEKRNRRIEDKHGWIRRFKSDDKRNKSDVQRFQKNEKLNEIRVKREIATCQETIGIEKKVSSMQWVKEDSALT